LFKKKYYVVALQKNVVSFLGNYSKDC
jgi:hypothetical protein